MTLPLQYAEGRAYFMDFELKVGAGVLIPRPETELLVERAAEACAALRCKRNDEKGILRVLDLCTGSGNIAISLTKYVRRSKILALDISPEALAAAGFNAAGLGAGENVSFVRSDLFGGICKKKYFDIIVSNPPYVSGADMATLPDDVLEEPRTALYGGPDGLDFYRRIACDAKYFLKKDGFILMEMGYDQSAAVRAILRAEGYRDTEIFKDYSGIDRIIKAANG